MERYNPVAQTRPKPPRVWLFAEERHWGQQFCQMDRDISVRSTKTSGPVKVDHLYGPPSKGVPNIPVGPNRNGPFHLISSRNFRDFALNRKRPVYPEVKGKKRGYSKGSHSPSLACYRLPPKSQGRLKNVVAADNAKFMSMG